MARGITLTQIFCIVFVAWVPIAKVIDSVYVILKKVTRNPFSMVLFITLDNVLTFLSLECDHSNELFIVYYVVMFESVDD